MTAYQPLRGAPRPDLRPVLRRWSLVATAGALLLLVTGTVLVVMTSGPPGVLGTGPAGSPVPAGTYEFAVYVAPLDAASGATCTATTPSGRRVAVPPDPPIDPSLRQRDIGGVQHIHTARWNVFTGRAPKSVTCTGPGVTDVALAKPSIDRGDRVGGFLFLLLAPVLLLLARAARKVGTSQARR